LKKFLFSTTALAVAGTLAFGADANAAAKPIKIAVGGFMSHEMGLGQNDGAFEAPDPGTGVSNKRAVFNNVQDSEVYFTGASKLDNGVTVNITIQLEADQASSGGNSIDESYMKLTGAFGDLRLGSTTGSNSVLKHVAPAVGQHPRLGGSDAYISVPAAVAGASNSTDANSSGDANKIAYISPRAGGLAFGASYTPSGANVNTAPVTGGNAADGSGVFEVALSYETTVGTSSLKADIAMEDRDNDTRAYRAGVNVGFGGFTIGGSVLTRNDRVEPRKSGNGSFKGHAYDLGATYAMGAYTFGLTKAYGAQTDSPAGGSATADDEQSKWSAGVSYALDTGVTLSATFTHADYDDGASGAAGTNNDGEAIVGAISVSF